MSTQLDTFMHSMSAQGGGMSPPSADPLHLAQADSGAVVLLNARWPDSVLCSDTLLRSMLARPGHPWATLDLTRSTLQLRALNGHALYHATAWYGAPLHLPDMPEGARAVHFELLLGYRSPLRGVANVQPTRELRG